MIQGSIKEGDTEKSLGDPVKDKVTWWAPTVFWEKGKLFYFTQQRNRTIMQIAEITLGEDGKLVCNRDKYLPAAPATAASQPGN